MTLFHPETRFRLNVLDDVCKSRVQFQIRASKTLLLLHKTILEMYELHTSQCPDTQKQPY